MSERAPLLSLPAADRLLYLGTSLIADTAVPSWTSAEGQAALGEALPHKLPDRGLLDAGQAWVAGGCDGDGVHFSVSELNFSSIVILSLGSSVISSL